MAWPTNQLDINLLLNSSWFTPLEDAPPKAAYSNEQAIGPHRDRGLPRRSSELRVDTGHDGRFGEDLQRAKAVGVWFRKVEPWIVNAQPAADILHGPNANAATEALARDSVCTRWIAPDRPLPSREIVVPAQTKVDETLTGRLRRRLRPKRRHRPSPRPSRGPGRTCQLRVKGHAAFEKGLHSGGPR